jgi:hypothetical protein
MVYPFTERRQVGAVLLVLAALLAVDLWALNGTLMRVNAQLHQTCNLPVAVCPFVGIPYQTVIGASLIAALAIFGVYLIVVARYGEKVVTKRRETFHKTIANLKGDERKVYDLLAGSGAMFQGDVVEKTGLNKVKVSRILDHLEGRGIVERRRRGMANMVVLKR